MKYLDLAIFETYQKLYSELDKATKTIMSYSEEEIKNFADKSSLAFLLCNLLIFEDHELESQAKIISYLLKYNTNFHKVTEYRFPKHLSIETYEAMLKNGLDTTVILQTALKTSRRSPSYNSEDYEKSKKMLNLALQYNIDFGKIDYLGENNYEYIQKLIDYGMPLGLAANLILDNYSPFGTLRFEDEIINCIGFLHQNKLNINEIIELLLSKKIMTEGVIQYLFENIELLNTNSASLNADNLLKLSLRSMSLNSFNVKENTKLLIEKALQQGANINKIITEFIFDIDSLISYKELFSSYNLSYDNLLLLTLRSTSNQSKITQDISEENFNTKKKELIKESTDHGASLLKSANHNYDLSIDFINELKNVLSPNDLLFLSFKLLTDSYRNDNPPKTRIYELIESAIVEKGADIDIDILLDKGRITNILSLTNDDKLISILKKHQAHCDIHSTVYPFILEEENLYEIFYNSLKFSKISENNLSVKPESNSKIPYLLHHIWLTHPSDPREIPFQDIYNTLYTKKKFQDSNNDQWHHILWTNDKKLIPDSVHRLEEGGVEIRLLEDNKEHIRAFDTIDRLIQTQKWGMASDLLRYSIVEHFGGAYADLNFDFKRNINSEIYKYDFFAQDFINNFFAAKPHHPIITHLVSMVERNLVSPPTYIALIDDSDVFTKTIYTSLHPFSISYFKAAHQNSNIDMVYSLFKTKPPKINSECKDIWFIQNHLYDILDINVCINRDIYLIGEDGYKDSHVTWVKE